MFDDLSRRSFLGQAAFAATAASAQAQTQAQGQGPGEKILGAGGVATSARSKKVWRPVSDRKIRVGIVGYGVCQFGAAFGFQDHPNVQVVAVSDLFPDRCANLAKACRCEKTYPSLEELVKDDSIEAVFVATDAPSHARHCIEAVRRGKHVACAVPAAFGSVEQAHELYEAVLASGRTYMMFETSAYHAECHAMRQVYRAGGFGKLVYSEGEYYHDSVEQIPSYKEWRVGLPPQWYPTHATAYYVMVAGGHFTEVSCLGMPSLKGPMQPGKNRYGNLFGTEVALLRTSEGGMSRMAMSWDTKVPGNETGRVFGQRGYMAGMTYHGDAKDLPDLERPALPPGVNPGGHEGSHGYLMNEFVTAILEDRKPLVDIVAALDMTVPGIVAHQSAIKGGETLRVPRWA
ncbi:Glycosyl hydrolase family 109 protein 1 precursor [Aquisphaera giovannonii]|uniref:Glycosyl hydrolase family 109 protein 1 n=1 Tax=Aquisphaera giovannonii TaxID=406548 RepID=A0A5B9VU10_9BACT|nr:Gfo/Idh/MocA family oxidoreductase [Aquisphaera giovannonii]QEH31549.1 Glycosyl hydrolase family 109 protein 1 precursor [Aquisphaera giovannonii]